MNFTPSRFHSERALVRSIAWKRAHFVLAAACSLTASPSSRTMPSHSIRSWLYSPCALTPGPRFQGVDQLLPPGSPSP
ncbi:hypothetical protein ACFPRL_27425 [Pseudoclavibacter helvolus]